MLDDVNPDDYKTENAALMDATLAVRFFKKDVKDSPETLKMGRPIYKEVEYVEIRIPGKRDIAACRPATYRDKQRFSKHYAAFEARTTAPMVGTPLAEFPLMNRNLVEEMSFHNIKTVEDLSSLSDTNASKFHNGLRFRNLAKEWLEAADETALLAERDDLKEQMATLQAQMAELVASKTEVAPHCEPSPIEPTVLDAAPVDPIEEVPVDPIEEVPVDPIEEVPLVQRRRHRKEKAE